MATHVSETTSTTTTSEQEEEQQTFLQLLWEKIKSVFGLIRRIIKILIILTLVVTIIITVGTGLSTTEESVWQGPSPAGSELRDIEITPEELDAYYRLMDVADTLHYDGMRWEGENARDFSKAYFPESYEADVKYVEFIHAPASVKMQYVTSGGNKEIELEFRRGKITKNIRIYHGFTENDFPGMIFWYAYDRFHTGYPRYVYEQDVADYGLIESVKIHKFMIKRKLFGKVILFADRIRSAMPKNGD